MFTAIPVGQAHQATKGAAAGVAIAVPSIHATHKLLAVVKWKDGGRVVVGLDPAAFVVSNDAIQSASVDTSGHSLEVVWATQPVLD
jgi:hypothetical protein